MSNRNLTQRKQVVNRAIKALDASNNQYKESQIIRDLLEFYRRPLVRAINKLNKVYKNSHQTIADEIFEGEKSRQAVSQNYTRSPK